MNNQDIYLLKSFQISWSKNKYWVMSRSQQAYNKIRLLAKGVFCKSFIHNIAKKKYITLQPEFFFNYFDFDNAFLSLKLSPVKLRMCA